MPIISYHKTFRKHFQKRINPHKSLVKKFEKRLNLFIKTPDDSQLQDHQLKGRKNRYRSFSITGDIRVVYKVEDRIIKLYDIGTHNQIY